MQFYLTKNDKKVLTITEYINNKISRAIMRYVLHKRLFQFFGAYKKMDNAGYPKNALIITKATFYY